MRQSEELLTELRQAFFQTGNIATDAPAFLRAHQAPHTAGHVEAVSNESARIAARFGVDVGDARIAGWLHDISVIIPNEERIAVAESLGITPLDEERAYPMIIHQRLSVVLAREIFGVTSPAVLSAIGCHTTLKAGASDLDKVVFIADKIAWDQTGEPPYLAEITAALTDSLDSAALVYIQYLMDRRDQLLVVHPWLVDAHAELTKS